MLVAAAGFAYVEYRFHEIHRVHVAGLAPLTRASGAAGAAAQPPETFLLIGDNCRDCLDGKQVSQFGSASEIGGGRSDVTMLLRIYPGTSRLSILSIPRDLWLPIPGTAGEIRVDDALNHGPSVLVRTISDDLDIPINHYVELNFDTFQDVVNAIGGIDMAFPTRMYDAYSHLNAPAGCYHLNGTEALQAVRARHLYYEQGGAWQYDGLGDISRIQRDHEFLRVLATTLVARGLGNPITDNRLIGALAKDLTIDSGLGIGDLADLARAFSRVDIAASLQTTLPVDEDNSPDGFVYDGDNYGDVVFPANGPDRPVVEAFLGLPAAPAGPSDLPVSVLGATASRTATVADQVHALGFRLAGSREQAPSSDPAESVVYYAPGHEPQAQELADELGGAVALGEDSALAGGGLTLLVGSNLTVREPPAVSASPTPAATPAEPPSASPTPAARPAAPPSAALIGGLTESDPSYPPFDPTGCAAGAAARSLPALPMPAGLPAT